MEQNFKSVLHFGEFLCILGTGGKILIPPAGEDALLWRGDICLFCFQLADFASSGHIAYDCGY